MSVAENMLFEALCRLKAFSKRAIEKGPCGLDVRQMNRDVEETLTKYTAQKYAPNRPVGIVLKRIHLETGKEWIGPELFEETKNLPIGTALYAEPVAPQPNRVLVPCEKHKGMTFTISVPSGGVPSVPYCPACEK